MADLATLPPASAYSVYDPVEHGWDQAYHLASADIPPVDWIVDRIVAPGTLNILSGPPRSFKSWLLHEMLVACATGGLFMQRFRTRRCRVMFIQSEESRRQHVRKFHWACSGAELSSKQVLEMHVLSWCGPMDLVDPVQREALRRAFEHWRPHLVLVDSLSRTHRGEEKDTELAHALKDGVDDFLRHFPDCAWVVIHHHRKSSSETRLNEPGEMLRGSSALLAVVDGHFAVQRAKEGNHTFVHDKCRDDQELPPFPFEFHAREGKSWFKALDPDDADQHADHGGVMPPARNQNLPGADYVQDGSRGRPAADREADRSKLVFILLPAGDAGMFETEAVERAHAQGVSRNRAREALTALEGSGRVEAERRPRRSGGTLWRLSAGALRPSINLNQALPLNPARDAPETHEAPPAGPADAAHGDAYEPE